MYYQTTINVSVCAKLNSANLVLMEGYKNHMPPFIAQMFYNDGIMVLLTKQQNVFHQSDAHVFY